MENINAESTKDITLILLKKNKSKVFMFMLFGLIFFLLVPIIGIIIILLPIGYYYSKAYKEFMHSFAQLNNMYYIEVGSVEDCRGRLFQVGHSRRVNNVITGAWNSFPIRLFNYSYTQSDDKNNITYSFTVMEISFNDIQFPSIFLKPRMMWGSFTPFGKYTNINIDNKLFSLFVAEGYEIEALQIFPDALLDYLTTSAPNFSIEFADNRINIYDDKNISNKKDLTLLLDVGKHIIDSSGAFISRLQDDFDALHHYYQDT